MGNGNRAQQKRERNKADAKKPAKSQLKVNQNAMDVKCDVCKTPFMKTSSIPQLEEHALNKHGKTLADCFPAKVQAA